MRRFTWFFGIALALLSTHGCSLFGDAEEEMTAEEYQAFEESSDPALDKPKTVPLPDAVKTPNATTNQPPSAELAKEHEKWDSELNRAVDLAMAYRWKEAIKVASDLPDLNDYRQKERQSFLTAAADAMDREDFVAAKREQRLANLEAEARTLRESLRSLTQAIREARPEVKVQPLPEPPPAVTTTEQRGPDLRQFLQFLEKKEE